MAPKVVDKARQERKAAVAADKTFGMKNKNKSKAVQKYIKQINQGLGGTKTTREEQLEKKAKDDALKEKQQKAVMNSLFNLQTDKKGKAYDPEAKTKARKQEEDAIASGKKLNEKLRKDIIEGIANTIRLTNPKGVRMSELGGHAIIQALKDKHSDAFKYLQLLLFIKANDKLFWVDDEESTNPMLRCQEDVDLEIEPDDRAIEDIIEERRRALPPGGTMVTLDTFKAWKIQREGMRIAAVEEARKAAATKKGDKGYSALSGKDLFTYDPTLFVDEDGAVSENDYEERTSQVDDDDNDGKTKGMVDADSEDDEEDEEKKEDGDDDAASSGEKAEAVDGEVAINKDLFLAEGDVDDEDLDDLDSDEEEAEGGAAA